MGPGPHGVPMTSSLNMDPSSGQRGPTSLKHGGPQMPRHMAPDQNQGSWHPHYPPPPPPAPYPQYNRAGSRDNYPAPYDQGHDMDPHGLHSVGSLSSFTTGMPRAPSVGYMGDNIKKVSGITTFTICYARFFFLLVCFKKLKLKLKLL
jgi:hypothetical protein